MTSISSRFQHLSEYINTLLRLFDKESSLKGSYNIKAIKTSRDKVVNPKFEIIFAGTYSAGKSMLINALLGRDLLFSGTGHVTGRECYIEYTEEQKNERIEFTFLSLKAIQEEVNDRCKQLSIKPGSINRSDSIEKILNECQQISKDQKNTEEAEEADGLIELLNGFKKHKEYIDSIDYKTYTMEELKLDYLSAYEYARRGIDSSVLQKIKYFCCHPLLEDGNVLVDLPGIDAPIQRDAQLTYRKVEDSNTSAVICVMKADQEGETETAEKKLIKAIQENPGISNRVFYVFNRIDKTWRDPQLKNELNDLIHSNFSHIEKIHETSALLGFYGSQIIECDKNNLWGLQSIFNINDQDIKAGANVPAFVLAFLDYCDSEKIPHDKFEVLRSNVKTKQQQYLEILNQHGKPLIEQLILDSGIQEFKDSINHYLTTEKRPELFKNLIGNIEDVCNDLYEKYSERLHEIKCQPEILHELIELELIDVNHEIQKISQNLYYFLEDEAQKLVMDKCEEFSQDYKKLNKKLEEKLEKLINNFSILDAFDNACKKYESVTAPLVTVLGEAFYEIANGIESVLVESSEILISNYFNQLVKSVRKYSEYRELNELLGNDCNIISELQEIEAEVIKEAKTIARSECCAFIIESPDLYDHEDSVWLYQFKETLQEASRSKDVKRILKAEPSIRQMLDIDFHNKLDEALGVNFSLKIIKSIKTPLINMAKKKKQFILEQAEVARNNKRNLIEQKAQQKIESKKIQLAEMQSMIKLYNQSASGINQYLDVMELSEYALPIVQDIEISNFDIKQTIDRKVEVGESIQVSDSLTQRQEEYSVNIALQRPSRSNVTSQVTSIATNLSIGSLVSCKITGLQEFGILVECQNKKGLIHKSNITGEFINVLDTQKHNFVVDKIIYAVYLGEDEKGMSLSTKPLERFPGEILKNLESVMSEAHLRVKNISKKLLS